MVVGEDDGNTTCLALGCMVQVQTVDNRALTWKRNSKSVEKEANNKKMKGARWHGPERDPCK